VFGFDPFSASPFSAISGSANVFDLQAQESATGSDSLASILTAQAAVSETATASDSIASQAVYDVSISESASASDATAGATFFISYLVVGGGGGGGSRNAGGGGGGGVVEAIDSEAFSLNTSYQVTVGQGGAGQLYAIPRTLAQAGDNSQFSSIIAYGGGRGAGYSNNDSGATAGGSGASGGGGVSFTGTGGPGTQG